MSSPTWTPIALRSERRRLSSICWRAVEAQHRVSTMKLVGTLAEQAMLEDVIERSKPALPVECRHLHYLLATPFRYGGLYPRGSRFRRAGVTPGVFYASRTPATAVAEMAFHRLLFFAESPGTPWPANAGEYTVFAARIGTSHALDLTRPPFDQHRAQWVHPTDYVGCQDLAEQARAAGIDALRTISARDPSRGINLTVLTCRPFATHKPIESQTWRIQLGASGARADCAFPDTRLEFNRQTFGSDPRIAAMPWERPGGVSATRPRGSPRS
jgi:hypothetical protein